MQAAKLVSASAGELVFDQCDVGDSFYIVYSGKIRILRRIEEDKDVNLGVRTRGDHFGETSLITDEPRNAIAKATEDSVLIRIDNEPFNNYLFSKPELREYFDKFIKYASIHQFLKTCSDLSTVSPLELQQLIKKLNLEFFKQNDVIFRQGAEPDKFYLIETGKLKVVRWEDDKQEVINFLREGEFFGEKALLEDTTRFADVVCLTDCHLFSLTKESFDELVTGSPKIRKIIEDRIKSYLTDKPPIPYQEMIKQELAASREIRVEEEIPADDIAKSQKKKQRFKNSDLSIANMCAFLLSSSTMR